MAPAEEMETFLGIPPNSAWARLPGVWTERVGMRLILLCLETKTNSWGVKKSVMNWVFTTSSLMKSSLTSAGPIYERLHTGRFGGGGDIGPPWSGPTNLPT